MGVLHFVFCSSPQLPSVGGLAELSSGRRRRGLFSYEEGLWDVYVLLVSYSELGHYLRCALHFDASHLQFLECLSCIVLEKWVVLLECALPSEEPHSRDATLDWTLEHPLWITVTHLSCLLPCSRAFLGHFRSSSTEIGVMFFFLLGKSIFQEKVFSQWPSSPFSFACCSFWEAWGL